MFTATQPIRDIVAELSSAAPILAQFEIDSSRHGDQNLEQACSAATDSAHRARASSLPAGAIAATDRIGEGIRKEARWGIR